VVYRRLGPDVGAVSAIILPIIPTIWPTSATATAASSSTCPANS